MTKSKIKHPIFDGEIVVKINFVEQNKGKWTPKPTWSELSVTCEDGTILQKVRHKTSSFGVKSGDQVSIIWIIPKNDNSPWYYTKQKISGQSLDDESNSAREWKALVEDVNPMSDDEREIFK